MISNINGQNNLDQALDALFWRDELLQVMYWMQGEGFAEVVLPQDLQIFLAADSSTIQFHLEQAANDGYLVRHPDPTGLFTRYSLSRMGKKEGGRRFADEFADMQKSGHGECSADCDCHQTGNYASCTNHQH